MITNNNQFGIGSGISCFRVASEFESRYNNPLEADDTEANESNEAEANEANEAIEADEDDDANKADLANEADEAEAEADNAVEAIATEEIEANVIDEIVAAVETIMIGEVIVVDATITKLKSDETTNRDIAEGRD